MRIAIYVRKSKWTGRGESIENQILMCREYIEKFIEDSREAEILVYSDEGFSGKDTNRPQFQKMLEDMKQGPFQYLVCYRLDRLGRNLADLALLIEKLNREHTEFVSIKEHFDTSTPMGKAMLYFSGVLAQMEREQIGERVRDNMFLLAKSGRWLGGSTPLGFHVREKLYGEGSFCTLILLPKQHKVLQRKKSVQEKGEPILRRLLGRSWEIRYTAKAGSWPMIILLRWAVVWDFPGRKSVKRKA